MSSGSSAPRSSGRQVKLSAMRPQFRLRPGRDDQLIAWLTSVKPRQRSQAIRKALRAHLAEREDAVRAEQEDPELAAALDALF